ncbi:IQ calmodulin-binding motif-containing 1 [Pelobates cultripes]|uniref:IQ calmodulin-binding motif-containing 1 n=2 Tax=Pelobates cultripes TaxID=61616 RepID=A0AAD1SKT3_PELCU|nr:IQ calmodulin-binding motif-containing 1 [Pelobates cultripes]CAH2305025.1 IQ calmodulin-binding motif-containing 1 [Pelobates cultripes]CAH2305026.1 IQ calmodulin-binding motif-containing 1 [Pelobates cultripes]CAH2305027.1 IQ calmodulin-binding motif-containing 1 [Pelobates cultripes]CAH2305030.1 IQ calmodulin-binding motif-containing 1 [Pelobates cultripes]
MAAPVDSRLLKLVAEITESRVEEVPVLLLKLKDFLKLVPPGSKELKELKEGLYHYDLIQYCVLVLKQDFSRVRGSWGTAADLADILSNCCVGLDPKEDPDEFYNKLLPSAVLHMLILGRRIQARFVRSIKDEERGQLFCSFRMVTDSLCWLFTGHLQLANTVLQQEHFLQLLMTDDVETGTVVMSVLQSILRADRVILNQVPDNVLHPILDELVYKLSASTNPVIGSAATRSLLQMIESRPDIGRIMGIRYKGLRSLLSKQWTGKGFGRELAHLLDRLQSGSYQREEMQRLHNAACTIQAMWRGFQIRKRVRRLPKAVATLQRSFRAKREKEMIQFKKHKEVEDLRQQLQLHRLRAMRAFREKQLTLLELVHAGQMDKHLHEIQENAALEIQRCWKGYKERKAFHQQKLILKKYKAAVTIQRAVLRFLRKRRKLRDSLSPWKKTRSLNDEQRLHLQQKIDAHIQLHPAQQRAPEQSQELHVQAQETLGQYLLRWKLEHGAEQRREALLAQIYTDIGMLMGAPSLSEGTEKDLEIFSSRSVPVALKAKQSHTTMLKRSRWPWWKKLSDEFIEETDAVMNDSFDMDQGIIFVAGAKTAKVTDSSGCPLP